MLSCQLFFLIQPPKGIGCDSRRAMRGQTLRRTHPQARLLSARTPHPPFASSQPALFRTHPAESYLNREVSKDSVGNCLDFAARNENFVLVAQSVDARGTRGDSRVSGDMNRPGCRRMSRSALGWFCAGLWCGSSAGRLSSTPVSQVRLAPEAEPIPGFLASSIGGDASLALSEWLETKL